MSAIRTIDTHYMGVVQGTAAYLLRDGDEAAFVETATTHARPHLLAALEDEGLSPEDVRYVIITHVHLDHAGGASALLEACPNATLVAHPRAAKHAIDPAKLVASAREVYGEARFESLYGTIAPVDEARVTIMEDGDSLDLGARTITFLHTRGHANHHFCVLDSASGAIFTGDSFGLVYPALQGSGRFAIPSTSPTDFDASAALESLDRILGTGAARAYPTHFDGYDDLDVIAGQLRAQLEQYGALVDAADASGLQDAALDAFCVEGVDAIFDSLYAEHDIDADGRTMLELDRTLNAQGLAFAVKKRRFKAGRG